MAYQQGPTGQPPYGPPPGYGYPPPPRPGKGPLFWLFVVGLPLVVLLSCTAALVVVDSTTPEPAGRLPAAQSPSTAVAQAPPPALESVPTTASTAPAAEAQPPAQPSQAPPPASGQRKTLLNDSGNGTKNTAQFTVDASWEVRYTYDCSGSVAGTGYLSATIKEGAAMVGLAANETGKSANKTNPQYRAGTFHLEVLASCPWTIEIIDVP